MTNVTEHDGIEVQVECAPDILDLMLVREAPDEWRYVNLNSREARHFSEILQEALEIVRRTEGEN